MVDVNLIISVSVLLVCVFIITGGIHSEYRSRRKGSDLGVSEHSETQHFVLKNGGSFWIERTYTNYPDSTENYIVRQVLASTTVWGDVSRKEAEDILNWAYDTTRKVPEVLRTATLVIPKEPSK